VTTEVGARYRNNPVCIRERVCECPVVPDMEPTTQYLRFAEECRRLGREAKSEQHRKLLEEMAQAWEKVAKEAAPESSTY
jgi:hypothetical protein